MIPTDTRKPYDVREVIARIVDGSEFDEFKARYGTTLVSGFAHIDGMPVGIIANNGILFSESAQKGAHFIELCCQRKHPAGVPAEHHRLHGRPQVRERRHRQRRRQDGDGGGHAPGAEVHGHHRRLFGAGNYGMCGRAYSPRFLWMWPNARICVMGGEQAASVLATVKRDGIEAQGRQLERRGRGGVQGSRSSSSTSTQGHPYYASARLWDDGVIDPADTRRVLALLAASLNAPIPAQFGVFRM